VILVSWNPEGFSPQIRAIAGNKGLGLSFQETKTSTIFKAGSGIPSSLDHNNWNLWLETLYFAREHMPVHLGHVVVDDHRSNRADCGNL
jgi:hypothetical protein